MFIFNMRETFCTWYKIFNRLLSNTVLPFINFLPHQSVRTHFS